MLKLNGNIAPLISKIRIPYYEPYYGPYYEPSFRTVKLIVNCTELLKC